MNEFDDVFDPYEAAAWTSEDAQEFFEGAEDAYLDTYWELKDSWPGMELV